MHFISVFFSGEQPLSQWQYAAVKSSRVPWSLWHSTKVQSDRLAWRRRWRSDPLAWILPELPNSPSSVPGPLPHQQSSPRLSVRFMQHPACQPLNVTPVPSPCASLSLSGMKWKPDASFFLLLPSFKPGIWSTGCRMEPLFMEPLISLAACHTVAPAGLVTTPTWGLRKREMKWYEKKKSLAWGLFFGLQFEVTFFF